MRTAPAGKFSDAWDKSAPSPPACLKLTANSFPPPFSSACLKEVVKGFRNYSFEPSGFCRVGDDTEADTCTEIRSCASVVDLIAKILAWLFPESNGYRLRDVFSIPSVSLPGQAPDTTVSVLPPRIITAPAHPATPALPEIPAGKVPEGTMLNGASLCPQCHSLAYVQDGKCKSCRSCGYKDGGCGE